MAKRKCPACAEWIQGEATKCKHCGAAIQPVPPSIGSKIVKLAVAAFTMWFVLSIFYGIAKHQEGGTHTTAAPTSPQSSTAAQMAAPPEMISQSVIVGAYERNEVAADNLYRGRVLRIVGKIRDIGKDITDDPYVTIGEDFRGVNCYFDAEHSNVIATLHKGRPIVFEGTCSGLTLGTVVMRHCSIPSEAQIRADYPDVAKQVDAPTKKRRRATDDE